MLSKKEIQKKLEKIYAKIPNFECKHCHECEGPIIWFKPEEIIIRDYLEKNNMQYIKWTKEEFQKNKNKCPYLMDDRCSIYPVRPIVCRLQGTTEDLPCKHNKKILLTKKQVNEIKKEYEQILREVDGIGVIYSTKKYQ